MKEEKKCTAEVTKLELRIKELETMLAEENVSSAKNETEHLKAQNEQLTLEKVQSETMLKKMLQQKDKQIQESL